MTSLGCPAPSSGQAMLARFGETQTECHFFAVSKECFFDKGQQKLQLHWVKVKKEIFVDKMVVFYLKNDLVVFTLQKEFVLSFICKKKENRLYSICNEIEIKINCSCFIYQKM